MQKTNLSTLLISHDEAAKKINARINLGQELVNRQIPSENEFEKFKADHEKWHKFNLELLRHMFSTQAMANEYENRGGGAFLMNQDWRYWEKREKEEISDEITKLESIVERLELIPNEKIGSANNDLKRPSNRKIFIVHGKDELAKTKVASFLVKLKLIPIILHEQANEGKTIIEKFEQHSDVDFAIVLLTPDDSGFSKDSPEKIYDRARQNVILELGYFMGKKGRKHVCALLKSGVEIPSDYQGILYIDFNDSDDWKMKLAKEMKISGVEIDMNDLF